MAILLLHKNAQGVMTGKCDARCYNAKGLRCRCVCGGLCHGKGKNNAILEIALFSDILEATKQPGDFIINPNQYILFPGGNL